MTVNIAFKAPDALVFATDGLATVMDVDDAGKETFLSNMENVEKLLLLSADAPGAELPLLAMHNGVGSLGAGTVGTDLRTFDRQTPRGPNETVAAYVARLAPWLEETARARLGTLPRPFHLIVAGFNPLGGGHASPSMHAIQWRLDPGSEPRVSPVLETPAGDGNDAVTHQFGAHYAGLTEAVTRFVEGFDPALPQRLGVALAGMGPASPPGLLEQLAQAAVRAAGAPPLAPRAAYDLAGPYAYRIVRAVFDNAPPAGMSQHFSLQSAIDYCVFLAQCAYARENLSPARTGPPRVGSTLQVAFLAPGHRATKLAGINLGIRVHGYSPIQGAVVT